MTKIIPPISYDRRVATEAVGSAFLLAAVVGSGIMGERLAGGNVAIALLANSLATGGALVALIVALGPISGAHFNPIVTLALAFRGAAPLREAPGYIAAQVGGAFFGVAAAHGMFGEALFTASEHARAGPSQILSELVATFGLVAVVLTTSRSRSSFGPVAVAGYITGAYWFTSSTCFANPAVTLARAASDTFAGIRPADVPLFVLAQLCGGAASIAFFRWVFGPAMKTIIFACVHNAGRSQMAAGFFNEMADSTRAHAASAGTQPASRIHDGVAQVMREVGIELEGVKPRLLTPEVVRGADLLITMGCGETCPRVPGLQTQDWALNDPKGLPVDEVRSIREEVRSRVEQLLDEEGWGNRSTR